MDDETRPFTIAAIEGVTLTKWTRAWQERMPQVPLVVVRTTSADQLVALAEGADVSFVRLPVGSDDGLSIIPLYSEAAFVVVPKDHAIAAVDEVTTADLADEYHLGGRYEDAIALVGANVGVVIVPQSIARLHSRSDVVARAVTDAAATDIALAWPTALTTDRVETFIGIVRGRTAASSRAIPTPPTPAVAKPAAQRAPRPSRAQSRAAATKRKRTGRH